jgi:hypothetical protein
METTPINSSILRTLNFDNEIYKLGDKVNTYKDVCMLTIEPKISDAVIFELGSKYFMDRFENNEHEIVLVSGYPVRTKHSYDDCIKFLKNIEILYPSQIFVVGIKYGKLNTDMINEAKTNKKLLDEILHP